MKIYTKRGDSGTTSLFGGGDYQKDDIRIEAYGTIDELNAALGLLKADNPMQGQEKIITRIQNNLFDIGSNLATKPGMEMPMPPVRSEDIVELEHQMDQMSENLPQLKHFILPGGSHQVSICHLTRTICRRAERRVVTLSQRDSVDPEAIKYLNRLSDYLFVLARATATHSGVEEIKWTGRDK